MGIHATIIFYASYPVNFCNIQLGKIHKYIPTNLSHDNFKFVTILAIS